VSTAVERDRRGHLTRNILCSLTSRFEGAAYKAAYGLGASGKAFPATGIRLVGWPTAVGDYGQALLVGSWPARSTTSGRPRWLWLSYPTEQCTVANHFWVGSAFLCLSVTLES
jgi:hypothetical protein